MDPQFLSSALVTTVSALDQSSRLLGDFVRDVPISRPTVDPITYELQDLRALLERLLDEDGGLPHALHTPILSLAAACRRVLARIDSVVVNCGGGPQRKEVWVSQAKNELRELKAGLQATRRAIRLSLEVVNLATIIEYMADDGSAKAVDVGAAEIKQDANQLLVRAHRVRAQVPRDERDDNRSFFALHRGLQGLVSFVESLYGAEFFDDVAALGQGHSSHGTSADSPHTPQSPQSPMSLRQIAHELSRISTSDSNPNSLSSAESRRTSEASMSWFTADDEENQSKPLHQRVLLQQRRHTNDTVETRKDPLCNVRRDLRMTPHSSAPAYSLYPPPPTRPLPAIPTRRKPSVPSTHVERPASSSTTRSSRSSKHSPSVSHLERMPSPHVPPSAAPPRAPPPAPPAGGAPSSAAAAPAAPDFTAQVSPDIDIVPWKRLVHGEKEQGAVTYVDASFTSSILASKQGNNMVRLWDLRTGREAAHVKVSFYVQAQPRSRDFFVRSHAILSETANLMAVATGFGHSLEIWNWAKRKKLQTMDQAYRWAAVRSDVYEASWAPLATYREDGDAIDLHPLAGRDAKKPFGKPRAIELRRAGLPHLPKYPELAYSTTGPLLVAAAGPRPPRPEQPPADHGPMLMAWGLSDSFDGLDPQDQPHRPYKFVVPEQYRELDNALPLSLATYGSVAVSIWMPARFRSVPYKGKKAGWQLEPVASNGRHVLVWDFAADATHAYAIPDVLACVSPDCRFVAWCDPAAGLAVLDALSGRELWRWAGGALLASPGFEQLQDLSRVTEMAFSADGSLFFVGDADGGSGVYEVREEKADKGMGGGPRALSLRSVAV